eukprot:1908864-Rhodomonas_salina.1
MLQRVVQRQDATGCSAQAVPVQGLALGFEQCPGGALDSITRRRAVAVQTARRGWALVALACGVQDAKNKNDPACRLDSDHTPAPAPAPGSKQTPNPKALALTPPPPPQLNADTPPPALPPSPGASSSPDATRRDAPALPEDRERCVADGQDRLSEVERRRHLLAAGVHVDCEVGGLRDAAAVTAAASRMETTQEELAASLPCAGRHRHCSALASIAAECKSMPVATTPTPIVDTPAARALLRA